jgi:AraC-like DNA-binding protein
MRVLREKISFPPGQSFRVIRWSRNLREVECLVAPGKGQKIAGEGTHWHYHTEMELTLFTSGSGIRFVGDHIGSFAAGDLVLLGGKLPHYWHAKGPSAGISVQWYFPESHPFWAFPETLPLAALFKRAGRGLRLGGRTAAAAAAQLQEMTQTGGAARLAVLLQLLARLATAPDADRTSLSVRSFSLSTESRHQQAIRDAVRHLIAHFRNEVRLEDVLDLTGLSRPTFARQFKKHSGRTFSEFLNRLRLQAACRELLEGHQGVLEIATECGFSQISFFNRLFRRVYKCNPTEYRQAKAGKPTGRES